MDKLQYLHNTLLENNMLDKSFEDFQAVALDKSYQQKVFQEASNRGMFGGSFVDFQNKYFPTQAATTTPTSTSTSKPTTTKKKEKEITVSEQEENNARQSATNAEFWDNLGPLYNRKEC